MTNKDNGPAAGGPDRFDSIEALLIRYPEISDAELADIKHWFHKEASALDVASLASKDEIADGYRQFRADHIDRFSAGDVLRAIAFVAVVVAILGGIILFRM